MKKNHTFTAKDRAASSRLRLCLLCAGARVAADAEGVRVLLRVVDAVDVHQVALELLLVVDAVAPLLAVRGARDVVGREQEGQHARLPAGDPQDGAVAQRALEAERAEVEGRQPPAVLLDRGHQLVERRLPFVRDSLGLHTVGRFRARRLYITRGHTMPIII